MLGDLHQLVGRAPTERHHLRLLLEHVAKPAVAELLLGFDQDAPGFDDALDLLVRGRLDPLGEALEKVVAAGTVLARRAVKLSASHRHASGHAAATGLGASVG